MTNLEKVYVVTQGIYSDYTIRGIFSSEGKAKEFCSFFPTTDQYDEPNIEEWELDDLGFPKGMKLYWVEMDRNGKSKIENLIPRNGITDSISEYNDGSITTLCWAKDENHAAKIANERRAMRNALATK